MVRFLTGEQILSSHYHVMENSKAQVSYQWCQRFVTKDYSSQGKMMTMCILLSGDLEQCFSATRPWHQLYLALIFIEKGIY